MIFNCLPDNPQKLEEHLKETNELLSIMISSVKTMETRIKFKNPKS